MSTGYRVNTCLKKTECLRFIRGECSLVTEGECRQDGHRHWLPAPPDQIRESAWKSTLDEGLSKAERARRFP